MRVRASAERLLSYNRRIYQVMALHCRFICIATLAVRRLEPQNKKKHTKNTAFTFRVHNIHPYVRVGSVYVCRFFVGVCVVARLQTRANGKDILRICASCLVCRAERVNLLFVPCNSIMRRLVRIFHSIYTSSSICLAAAARARGHQVYYVHNARCS